MTIVLGVPVLQSVGSADDGDAATPPCSYGPVAGAGQCTDGPSGSSGSPQNATALTCLAQAVTGPNATTAVMANAKSSAKATLTIGYSWWERIKAFFGWRARLAATFAFTCFADVNDGGNQATFALFITGGGGAAPLPVYQRAYRFARVAGNPPRLNVTKDGAGVGAIANPGVYAEADAGRTVRIGPGAYDLQLEINAAASADGRVVLGPAIVLTLAQA